MQGKASLQEPLSSLLLVRKGVSPHCTKANLITTKDARPHCTEANLVRCLESLRKSVTNANIQRALSPLVIQQWHWLSSRPAFVRDAWDLTMTSKVCEAQRTLGDDLNLLLSFLRSDLQTQISCSHSAILKKQI